MRAVGIDFNEREWLWRVFLHPEQTTLVKGRHLNRFYTNAVKRKRERQVMLERYLDEGLENRETGWIDAEDRRRRR